MIESINCPSLRSLWHSKLSLKTLLEESLLDIKLSTKSSKNIESSNDESFKLSTGKDTQIYLHHFLKMLVCTTNFTSRVESILSMISSSGNWLNFSFFVTPPLFFFLSFVVEFTISLLEIETFSLLISLNFLHSFLSSFLKYLFYRITCHFSSCHFVKNLLK